MALIARVDRVLLDGGTTAVVDALAEELGWSLLNIYPRREGRPRQRFYGAESGEAMIVAVDDHRIAATYLLVQGYDPAGECERVRACVAHITEADLLATLDSAAAGSSEHVRALAWLGLVARPSNANARALLDEAAQSEHAAARDAAAFALEALES